MTRAPTRAEAEALITWIDRLPAETRAEIQEHLAACSPQREPVRRPIPSSVDDH